MSDSTKEIQFRVINKTYFENMEYTSLTYNNGLFFNSDLALTEEIGPKILDSGINNCLWHKIKIDADLENNTWVKVYYCISGSSQDIDWNSAQVMTAVFSNQKTLLIQNTDENYEEIRGRYLHLKIQLGRGLVKQNLLLREIRFYYQNNSYINYLPEFYQNDLKRKNFLERFLAIFEDSFKEQDELISNVHLYLDPEIASDDFLSWLSKWVNLDLYDLLGERNSEFILKAADFYSQKGTLNSLSELITFLTGKECAITEYKKQVFKSYNSVVDLNQSIVVYPHKKTYSTVFNTEDQESIYSLGTIDDKVHYVSDFSEDSFHNQNMICIYIYVPLGESIDENFIIDETDLLKIIDSFLPVFVNARIEIVQNASENYAINKMTESYVSSLDFVEIEAYDGINGKYMDSYQWDLLNSNQVSNSSVSNSLDFRTYNDKVYTWVAL